MTLDLVQDKIVPGYVYKIRFRDSPQDDQVLDSLPADISYDVLIWSKEMKGYVFAVRPDNRIATNVNIDSAKAGTPCTVRISQTEPPKLYLTESIPFTICATSPPSPLTSGPSVLPSFGPTLFGSPLTT